MLADVDLELDLGVAGDEGWADFEALRVPLLPARRGEPAAGRTGAHRRALDRPARLRASGLPRGRFATLDAVTADVERGAAMQRRFDVSIESMEGAAAAAVAAASACRSRSCGRCRTWWASATGRAGTCAAPSARRPTRRRRRSAASPVHPTWDRIARDTAESDFMTGW
jgi:hypothetical protein